MTRGVALLLALVISAAARAETLTVLAAASLRESFTELARTFEQSHPGVHVRLSFAGSQQLAASILLDAPADVFASADTVQMKRVTSAQKVREVRPLCSNRLIVAVSAHASGKFHTLADLAKPGVRVVIANAHVPVGNYTQNVLAQMPKATSRGILANVVSRESDVRTVLTRVALGEADAGFVYTTDLATRRGLGSLPIPDRVQTPVLYEVAVVNRTQLSSLASQFCELARGKSGSEILRRHGFLPPPHKA